MGGGASAVDDDLAPICAKLNLKPKDAQQLHKKFQDIDVDGSGVIDVNEFFRYISMEPTPFGVKLFSLIDENASGEIDFNEFLVGLWNMCTFDEEALLKFAFQLIDDDNSGYVDNDEIVEMVKSVHVKKFDRKLVPHVKKVMAKFDKNGDHKFSFDEFKGCHKELPLLFMPAFSLKNCMEDEFFGERFWRQAKKARKKDMRAQSIREFMVLNRECQAVASDKYGEGGGKKTSKATGRPKKKVWEAGTIDSRAMRAEEFDPGKKAAVTRGDKLEDRYAKIEKSGIRRFSVDMDEAKRDFKKDPVIREDRKRFVEKDVIKGSKSDQYQKTKGRNNDYVAPRRKR